MSSAPVRNRVLSGIQPSGVSHIGNYLGAIRNWVDQQDIYDSIFCIVNLHALSLPTDPAVLREHTVTMANTLLAAGINPARAILFVQSDVREHSELCWLFNSVTQFGELRRMTQFKDKSSGQDEGVSAALFSYPVLQAADILIYDADLVPVGEDQRQHVELTRNVAIRFNARYGETFVVPAPDIKTEGAKIMALDDPDKKMSKSSASVGSYIALTDTADEIVRKIKRAVTDSGGEIKAGSDKPAITNLLTIHSLLSGTSIPDLETHFAGKGYGALKTELTEVIVTALGPIQQRLAELQADPAYTIGVLNDGADRARTRASVKLAVVRDRMGLTRGPSAPIAQ